MQIKSPSNNDLATLGSGGIFGASGLPYMKINDKPFYPNKLFREWFLDQVLLPLVPFRVYQRETDTALQYSVMGGKTDYFDGEIECEDYTAQPLSASATNYIYLPASGVPVINTTGFPKQSITPHIKMAEVPTTADAIVAIIDRRPASIFNFGGGGGDADVITVYNDTGVEIAAGKLLYISGYDSTNACYEVALADADDPGKPAQLIANETIANGSTGQAGKKYDLSAQDTSGQAVGDPVYLSATAGEWTSTAPTGDSQTKQEIGVVTSVDAATGTVRLYCGYAGGAERIDINALPSEISTFFGATDITGTEAETLTSSVDADSLHTHASKADASVVAAHTENTSNPHCVTALQAGADVTGTAAAAIGAHETTYNHATLVNYIATKSVSRSVDGATYTVGSTDHVILADADTDDLTIALPAAASSNKRVIVIKKITAANNVITDGNASETIDDATTLTLTTQYTSITIVCDGTSWHII